MYGVTLAFKDFKIREGIMGSPWVGMKYFKQIFNSYSFWEEDQITEYNGFIQEMSAALQGTTFSQLNEEDPLQYLTKTAGLMYDRDSDVRHHKKFLDSIDINKIIVGLEKATAKQVSDFRRGILSTYGIVNIREFLPDDRDALIKLRAGVQGLLESNRGSDKIVKLQYRWLVDNIDAVLKNY